MDIAARFDNLDRLIVENKLLRKSWTDGADRACLLAALSPEVGEQKSAHSCPSSLLSPWFAHLTPQMDDNGSIEKWPDFVKRYAHIVRNAALSLDAPAWRRAEYRVRALAVREAMMHTDNADVLIVCKASVAFCDRISIGDEPTEEERSAAESAAWSAAWDRMNDGILDILNTETIRMKENR